MKIVETLMARMDTLEDMTRQKRNLDACLDSFEERSAAIHNDASLLNANICTNREKSR